MHKIKELKDMLCAELEEYGSKESLTASDLDIVDKMAHTVKNLDKILTGVEGYSRDGYSTRMYYDRSFDDRMLDGDYSRRGRMNAKRDSMGRYSGDAAMDELRTMMNEERDETKRRKIQSIIQSLE